jgi:hypothetical protein
MMEKSTSKLKWPPMHSVQSYESLGEVFCMCVEVKSDQSVVILHRSVYALHSVVQTLHRGVGLSYKAV